MDKFFHCDDCNYDLCCSCVQREDDRNSHQSQEKNIVDGEGKYIVDEREMRYASRIWWDIVNEKDDVNTHYTNPFLLINHHATPF